jgi:hypothetical protein
VCALSLLLGTCLAHATPPGTTASSTPSSGANSEVIDPDEVVRPGQDLEDNLAKGEFRPRQLCVIEGSQMRYFLRIPIHNARVWGGCYGSDRLSLEDDRFFTLVGRRDLFDRQRARNRLFIGLFVGRLVATLGGAVLTVYGFTRPSESERVPLIGLGLGLALGVPITLGIVENTIPLQVISVEEAQGLAGSYNRAHAEGETSASFAPFDHEFAGIHASLLNVAF